MDEAFGPRGDLVPTQLTEWRIGTGGDALTFSETPLHDRPMDLPSHDRRLTGRRTDHGWFATTTSADSEHGFELNGICHFDVATGKQAKAIYRIGEQYTSADETLSKLGWVPNRQPGTRGATLRRAA